ncbi:hypothetical protein [Nitrospira sp. Nam74]
MHTALRQFSQSPTTCLEVSDHPESLYRLLQEVSPTGLTDGVGSCSRGLRGCQPLQPNVPVVTSDWMRTWAQDTLIAGFLARLEPIVTHLAAIPDGAFILLSDVETALTTVAEEARRLRFLDGPESMLCASVSWDRQTIRNALSRRDSPWASGVYRKMSNGAHGLNSCTSVVSACAFPEAVYEELDALPWTLVDSHCARSISQAMPM